MVLPGLGLTTIVLIAGLMRRRLRPPSRTQDPCGRSCHARAVIQSATRDSDPVRHRSGGVRRPEPGGRMTPPATSDRRSPRSTTCSYFWSSSAASGCLVSRNKVRSRLRSITRTGFTSGRRRAHRSPNSAFTVRPHPPTSAHGGHLRPTGLESRTPSQEVRHYPASRSASYGFTGLQRRPVVHGLERQANDDPVKLLVSDRRG